MNNEPILENLSRFERYAGGEMDEEEKKAFENELKDDPRLAKAYRKYKEIYNAVSDSELIALRKQLLEIERNGKWDDHSRGRIVSPGLWYWIAATVAVLITFSVILLISLNPMNDSEELIATAGVNIPEGAEYKVPGSYLDLKKMVVRGEGLIMQAPPDSLIFYQGQAISLSWTPSVKEGVQVEVFDNKGQKVLGFSRVKEQTLIISEDLDPGVYLYIMGVNGKVIHTGLFFVLNTDPAGQEWGGS